MDKTLKKISDIIETYESGAWVSVENLRVMLRELSSNYYFLTKYNIEAFNKWNTIVYESSGSVNRSEIEAHKQVPELRLTRKILIATSKVVDSMRSELSIIKND